MRVSLVWMMLVVVGASSGADDTPIPVSIDCQSVVTEVSERYMSVALGSSLIREHWTDWNFRSDRLRALAAELSPAYMRLGGTDADFLIYDPKPGDKTLHDPMKSDPHDPTRSYKLNSSKMGDIRNRKLRTGVQLDTCDGWRTCKPKHKTNFTMSVSDWDAINTFCLDAGWRLLFDFNVFLRKGSTWSVDNARTLLEQSTRNGYTNNLDYELGNEPNAYFHNFNITMSGQQLGEDFLRLHRLIHNLTRTENTSPSLLVGPDITRPTGKHSKSVKFLKQFLPVANKVVDAITWHQYYLNGRTAVVENFTDPAVLDLLKGQLRNLHRAIKAARSVGKRVWLGETSSAWGGGAKGLSDTYVAGFMWLDKLGLAALGGVDTVIRQTFFRGHYALVNNNLQPRPDYWLSLLFKRIVGRKVLRVTTGKDLETIRLYAHCANTHSFDYPPGSVTLYGMNLKDQDVTLTLSDDLGTAVLDQYLLTPHTKGKLTSAFVRLNGKTLKMLDDVTFPRFFPKKLKSGNTITIPSKTFGFFVIIPSTNIASNVCMQ